MHFVKVFYTKVSRIRRLTLPKDKKAVGAKWVFGNKLDEDDKVATNKARLVVKGYAQQECIDYTETYVHVAHLEAIHILLSFIAYKNMKLYQMDVKSAILNELIQKEVYAEQLPLFESDIFPHHVFKLNKALYRLKQAP